jgi:RNA polymerase sigma factor (sigma-70 family)
VKSSNDLLTEYCNTGSEPAFRELVKRYIGLVYSSALRLLDGDAHLAEDVAQTVFIDLSRKARGLKKEVALGGWLHQRTFNVAAPLIRSNRRRQARERAAMENDAMQNTPNEQLAQFAPVLDEAINELSAEDRFAVLMRFFERQSFSSIGLALGITDDTAQKRVSRALEKLHVLLRKRGVTLTIPAVAAALAADSLTAAPVGLASTIAGGVLGGSISGGVLTSKLIHNIAMTKMKVSVIGAVVIVGGGAVLLQLNSTIGRLRSEIGQLRAQQQNVNHPVAPAFFNSTSASQPSVAQPSEAEVLRLRGQIGRMNLELQTLRSNRISQAGLAAMLLHPLDLSQFPDSSFPIKASMATNAGTATPNALLQTWLWAKRTGDPDGLLATQDWPDGTSDAKKLEDVNKDSKSAQGGGRSDGSFEDYKLVALWRLGDEFYLGVFDESGNPGIFGKTVSGKQFFHKTQEGWRITNYTPSQGAFLTENGGWRTDFQSESGPH